MTDSSSPLAIVDFADEIGSSPRRLAFSSPRAVHRAERLEDVVTALDAADRAARDGGWVVGFVSFEAAAAFDPAFAHASGRALPLAWFAEFDAPTLSGGVPVLADETTGAAHAGVLAPVTPVGNAEYATAVRRIHAYIDAGDVYQVNYTVPFTSPLAAPPRTAYEWMRDAQGGSYSCYLDIGDAHILSASPELFFERRGAWLRSRPMKGTAPRAPHPAADAGARDVLRRSEKDRAENVMIVDVVRNDLGRVARVGTVRVSALCEPERYPSVWQLTSTVEAEVDPQLSLASVFAALFPPASVTGAPKIRATAIIRELERGAREVYCGAVGIVRPGGDATFNVAIRTAWTTSAAETLQLGAGGGITSDSTVHGELDEVRAKLAAFTRPKLTPALFETIRIERGTAVRLERHLARLGASADHFDIPFHVAAARRAVDAALRTAASIDLARARLELSARGELRAEVRPHRDEMRDGPAPIALATSPIEARDVRLYHKCVDRHLYDQALAAAPGMFDVLLWNADGAATELTRGNLVAEVDGRRLTPPVECGLLAGTFRAELLERGEISERVLTLDDVRRAGRLWFVNSLRGWVPVALVERGAADAARATTG